MNGLGADAAHPRRITSLAAWRGRRQDAVLIRWSEVGPAVIPTQTLVVVEVGERGRVATGCAALTSYTSDGHEASLDGHLEGVFARWLGAPVWGLPDHSGEDNPYDPVASPLRATIELAVLDALGRLTGLPAAAFLGGVRRSKIEAYASLPSFADPEAAVSCAANAVARGFRAVKFHAAGQLDEDTATIAAARTRLDRGVRLMWDASCAYDLYTALAVGRALEEADFLWFEAPFADDSVEALRVLASRTSIALVPDGLVQRTAAEWARDVREGVWGALRLDITRATDLASALRLLHLAETVGLPCEVQSFGFPLSQYANLQLLLTTNACRFFEVPFPTEHFDDGIVAPPPTVDGFVHAPTVPGLGHSLDPGRIPDRLEPLSHQTL
jgi:L-alanine-DL-glutamate epimerase-like enolase superfamily enzyme